MRSCKLVILWGRASDWVIACSHAHAPLPHPVFETIRMHQCCGNLHGFFIAKQDLMGEVPKRHSRYFWNNSKHVLPHSLSRGESRVLLSEIRSPPRWRQRSPNQQRTNEIHLVKSKDVILSFWSSSFSQYASSTYNWFDRTLIRTSSGRPWSPRTVQPTFPNSPVRDWLGNGSDGVLPTVDWSREVCGDRHARIFPSSRPIGIIVSCNGCNSTLQSLYRGVPCMWLLCCRRFPPILRCGTRRIICPDEMRIRHSGCSCLASRPGSMLIRLSGHLRMDKRQWHLQ